MADDGYEFGSLAVTDAEGNAVSTTAVTAGTTYTFTMMENNVTVSATFKIITYYTVAVNTATNGTVTADKTSARSGDTITLTLEADGGYEFASLAVTDAEGNAVITTAVTASAAYTFTMPENNITVSAIFAKINTVAFNTATNGTVTADKTSTLSGDTITLTLVADDGYEFGSLAVTDAEGNAVITTAVTTGTTYTFTMPESNVTVSATFVEKILYTTADDIVSTIQSLKETVTVKLSGKITEDLLTEICAAINAMPKGVYVKLDMSKATGVTTFQSSISSWEIDYAKQFYRCTKLKSIVLPDVLETLGKCAFYGCSALESITIPDSVTSIGIYSFYRCTSLKEISLSKNLTSIYFANLPFKSTTALTAINVDPENPEYASVDGVLYSKDMTILLVVPSTITEYEIPSSVTTIYGCAFDCSAIKNITIPSTVTKIGSYAFTESALESIVIPATVTSLGNNVFESCKRLENASIEPGITTLPGSLFSSCSRLKSFTIPDTVKTINYRCFYYCSSLESITILESVTKIGYNQFSSCEALTSITFANTENWYASKKSSYYTYPDSDKVSENDLTTVSNWTSPSGLFHSKNLYKKTE